MGVCLSLAASDVVGTNEIVVFYRKQKKVEFKKKLIMEFVYTKKEYDYVSE